MKTMTIWKSLRSNGNIKRIFAVCFFQLCAGSKPQQLKLVTNQLSSDTRLKSMFQASTKFCNIFSKIHFSGRTFLCYTVFSHSGWFILFFFIFFIIYVCIASLYLPRLWKISKFYFITYSSSIESSRFPTSFRGISHLVTASRFRDDSDWHISVFK